MKLKNTHWITMIILFAMSFVYVDAEVLKYIFEEDDEPNDETRED